MGTERVVIGIDASTTATKAIAVTEKGQVRGIGTSSYSYDTPRPLWSEQDPRLWTTATDEAVRSVIAEADLEPADVSAIGLAGQMHGLTLLNAHGEPLRPAILWNDQRTAAECAEIRDRVGFETLVATTGNDALTGFTAPKILWVRNNEPDVFASATTALLPKDYVRFALTGEFATDKAGAAGTGLFDVAARDWSPEVTAALGIDLALLPPTFEGSEAPSSLSTEAADRLGLTPGTPVVAGGGDQAANAVGTGVVDPGRMALSLGTSGVVFAATERPAVEVSGRVHSFCHAVPSRWHLMGVMLSAAGSLRWFRDTFAPAVPFADLVAEAATAPPGAEGLLFLPYLTGERTPHPDADARGAFIGLTVRHERRHLVRAVLEGVAFGLRDGLDLMYGTGLAPVQEIRASGGGTRSALWRQIIADVLGADLVSVNSSEGAAYGAAVLAAVNAGWFDDAASAAAAWVEETGRTPHGEQDYSALQAAYAEQYGLLAPTFRRLGDLTTA